MVYFTVVIGVLFVFVLIFVGLIYISWLCIKGSKNVRRFLQKEVNLRFTYFCSFLASSFSNQANDDCDGNHGCYRISEHFRLHNSRSRLWTRLWLNLWIRVCRSLLALLSFQRWKRVWLCLSISCTDCGRIIVLLQETHQPKWPQQFKSHKTFIITLNLTL